MMRRLAALLFDLPLRWVEDSIPAEAILHEALTGYQQLIRQFTAAPDGFSEQAVSDLHETAKCLLEIGLIHSLPVGFEKSDQPDSTSMVSKARSWREALPEGKLLVKTAFARGCGKMLDWLDEFGDKADRVFVTESLEKLLRHVEVKRKASLQQTFPDQSVTQIAVERERVIILFCHVARRRRDLRLLNAVFKLNDWSFRKYRRATTIPLDLRCCHLRGLAEQEAAAKELLQ